MTPADPDLESLARACTAEMWRGDAASRMLGMEVLRVAPGRAVVAMTVREDMVNGWDLCHGGLIATLADSAFAVACNSRGQVTVAAGFDVTFLEPAHRGDRLVAVAREIALRGRSGLYDVTVSRSPGAGTGVGAGREGDHEPDAVVIAELRGRSRATGRTSPAAEDG